LLTYFLFMAGSWLTEDALALLGGRRKKPSIAAPETEGV
jgi:hypothetical protein